MSRSKFFFRTLPLFFAVVLVLVSGFVYLTFRAATPAQAGWYGAGWAFRKSIVINYTKVSGAQTNFPVLISFTDAGLQANAQADADDILFTSSDGTTKLDHEIEVYISSSGGLTAWVEIPSLSASVNTTIFMYYGNGGVSSQQNATGVWDSNYVLVSHLANGTTLSATDSTSFANNGTITGATATSGQVDGAADFDGAGDDIDYGNDAELQSVSLKTISFWMRNDDTTASYALMVKNDEAYNSGWALVFDFPASKLNFLIDFDGVSDGDWHPTADFTSGVLYYVSMTYDSSSSSNVPIFYVNGASVAITTYSTPAGTVVSDAAYNLQLGSFGNGNRRLNGMLDEVRYSNIIRGASWVATEYNNQSATSTFYTLGPAQTSLPAHVKVRGGSGGGKVQVRGGGGGNVKFR